MVIIRVLPMGMLSALTTELSCLVDNLTGVHFSLSEGGCCNEDCQLMTKADKFVCSDETECATSSACDGTQSSCPSPKPKSNANTCREGTMVRFFDSLTNKGGGHRGTILAS